MMEMGKMMQQGKPDMKTAKMHYDALMEALAAIGISLAQFEDQIESEKLGEEEGGEYQEPMDEEEESPISKKPMDKSKIAVIVARMKNKEKA